MRQRVLHGRPVQFRCLFSHNIAKVSGFLRGLCYHVARRQHDLIRYETHGYPLTGTNSFSLLTVWDSIDFSPEISKVRGNVVINTIACGFLQLVSKAQDACLENVKGSAGLSADLSPMPKLSASVYLKTKFAITGVNIRTDHFNQKWMDRGFNELCKELPAEHFCFPCSPWICALTCVEQLIYEF